ncbi:pyridine nucleotide-disulfide oxidoreductase [Glutamicibacter uratoxydans]|uniref:Pyridine nucleotide-disulfide oxidoreductase n=1 Tax=Glutamicibacter uratoxydans TaxID=43667 RepID=A0A4Y4DQ26_GLUUR|nr:FAD-dependent oxidoreductase [Glutamicibacter uratoxydans]GED05640.1 pyridine nucleotide-disulfide oxidoreductase [Glutamicibacter uratoxydans]
MGNQQHVAIIGGGLAGAKSAEELRAKGFEGAISIFAAEDHLPYERPPFSKDYLQSKSEFADALVHDGQWYQEHEISVHQNTRVVSIDPEAKTLATEAGEIVGWDKLILATGSAARRLPLPGTDASNVYYLRTVEDSTNIRSHFGKGKNLVIIGGGWIGLEVAAAARAAETNVTILEGAAAPLLNVLGPENAAVFAKLHTDHGVNLRTGVKITELAVEGSAATGVMLAGGEVVPADAVVIGIGVAPEVQLAESAGLDVENGVLVDAALRTSNPEIFAVGDIANQAHPVLGHRVRVEHWATALNQPAAVAASITGQPTEYTELPYFFSDQYDLGMEYIGNAPNGSYDKIVVRGDAGSLEFLAFWVSAEGRVLAGMNVNVWDVVDDVKSLILSGRSVDAAKLADPSVPLGEL